jgi:hypothetical protein
MGGGSGREIEGGGGDQGEDRAALARARAPTWKARRDALDDLAARGASECAGGNRRYEERLERSAETRSRQDIGE